MRKLEKKKWDLGLCTSGAPYRKEASPVPRSYLCCLSKLKIKAKFYYYSLHYFIF